MVDFIPNDEISFATPESYQFDDEGYVDQLLTDGTYIRLFHPETFENECEFDIYGRTELEYLKDTDLKTYVKLVYTNELENYITTISKYKKDEVNSISDSLVKSGYCTSKADAESIAREIMNS